MSSAAVIGRQLRQQQTNSRVSGPVVPPTQYKGRQTQTKLDRDLLSVATQSNIGADADKKFAKFSQLYSYHDFYPHPAHRENSEKLTRKKEKKKSEPRVQCTWHCFCVALKALSSGIILLLVGTVMSVLGFFAESLALEEKMDVNGNLVTTVNSDIKAHLHNLTYVGPVIMGLGGIVIVAACVLTFEVRDTLGVKIKLTKTEVPSTARSTVGITLNGVSCSVLQNDQPPNHSVPTRPSNILNQPPAIFSAQVSSTVNQNYLSPNALLSTIQESQTNQYKPAHYNKIPQNFQKNVHLTQAAKSNLCAEQLPSLVPKYNGCDSTDDISSIDMSCLQIPSPYDTELSDPEGCSLDNFAKWKSRCSCSGSPTSSMRLALHNIDLMQASQHCGYSNRQQRNSQPFVSQLPDRYSKILASVESDGLSSASSTDWNDMNSRLVKAQQSLTAHNHYSIAHHHQHLHSSPDKCRASMPRGTSGQFYRADNPYNSCQSSAPSETSSPFRVNASSMREMNLGLVQNIYPHCHHSPTNSSLSSPYHKQQPVYHNPSLKVLNPDSNSQRCYPLLKISGIEHSNGNSIN